MEEWKFKAFVDKNGVSFIDEWYSFLPGKCQARFDARLTYLKITKSWPPKYFKKLKGYDHIFEHRFKFDNMQHRPLGCYGKGENEFIFLIGATKREKIFTPRSAVKNALDRRNNILKDKGYVDDIENLQAKLISKTKE